MHVPKVQVPFDKAQKYVVFSVDAEEGHVDMLWGDPDLTWHNDIIEKAKSLGLAIHKIYGGGRIFIDEQKKQIFVWGTSDRFGPAPRYLVEEMIEGEYPDYKLLFNCEPHQA